MVESNIKNHHHFFYPQRYRICIYIYFFLDRPKKYLVFDILSYQNLTNERGRSMIGQLKIPIKIIVPATTCQPSPKFNMGEILLDIAN